MTAEQTIMSLILDSLEIKNFRAFKHLRIEKLGRVNLIVGKNNVGKSSVLDALRLYAMRGEPFTISLLLNERDELALEETEARHGVVDAHEFAVAMNNLFCERRDTRQPHEAIVVGSTHDPENRVLLDVVWPVLLVNSRNDGDKTNNSPHNPNQTPELSGTFGTHTHFQFPLDRYYQWGSFAEAPETTKHFTLLYIGLTGLRPTVSALLWDFIALSDLEQDVLFALRIIAPELMALNFVGDKSKSRIRIPKIRTVGSNSPIPLRSMGEGMNRMLGIALALVNAKDGMLLIDEVDTGLHYSVLPDLWRLIFEVAHRLNVQVFATSHSWDCIQAFQQAADANTEEEGMLIRLEHRDGDVVPVMFDERKLNIAAREQIEVR